MVVVLVVVVLAMEEVSGRLVVVFVVRGFSDAVRYDCGVVMVFDGDGGGV